jgi:hypothetical protein
MDESLLIAVFMPTTDETGKDFGGNRGELATGYPVSKDLILTAGHVLQPGSPYYRDLRYRVKLRWHHFHSTDDSDWIEISEENIVWRAQGDLDAALIRCCRPPDAVGWGIVSREKPLDRTRWMSKGFARATKCEDVRNLGRFGGEICTIEDSCFELTEDVQSKKDEDWHGVAGMPVFVGRKILGVVRSIPPNIDAKELDATPTWKLLKDEGFRREIGYNEQLEHVDSVKVELARTLARSPDAIDMLVEKLRLDNEMTGLDHTQRAKQLVERLLPETDSRVVIDTLRHIHRSLCEDDEAAEQGTKAAEIVAKAAQLIVPAVYDYGVVKWTRNQKGNDGVAPVLLPAGIKTVAEIIMAGVDGRKTKFHHRRTEKDYYPEGELSLPQLPECGIDPSGANARQALQTHLEGKFISEKAGELRRVVDDYLIATKYPSEPGKEGVISWEQRIKPTADQIARESCDSKQTFYLVLPLPEDVEGENTMRSLAKSLKKDYSAIMFLSLDPAYQQEKQDRDLVYSFCCMLPLQRGDPTAVAKQWTETTDSSPTAPQKEPSSMRFKIALSYPGERRDFVKQVADRLADQVGRDRVLYDRYYEAEFARPGLATYLQHLYHDESELIAVFLCTDYERKEWCGLEWRAVLDLIKQRQAATVMPLRFDDTEIPGLFSIDGYVWIGGRTPQEIADLILQRMNINASHTPAPPPSSTSTSPMATPPSPGLQTWKEKLGQVVKRIWR